MPTNNQIYNLKTSPQINTTIRSYYPYKATHQTQDHSTNYQLPQNIMPLTQSTQKTG